MTPTPNNSGPPTIDPIQYGMLLASVEALKSQHVDMKRDFDARMEAMSEQIGELLELANKSKGGLWVGMTLAATLGSFATWVLKELMGGKP